MKCFFALRLDEASHRRLEQLCLRMQEWQLPARWVHPADLHVTLCYLGEVAEDQLARLRYRVDTLLSSQLQPSLQLDGLGAFAGRRWPRVIYAGIRDPEQWCGDLHQDLAGLCGVQAGRSFVPHVTLCRPQGRGEERDWPELLQAYAALAGMELDIADIALFESQPSRQPRYRLLHSWPLIPSPV